MTNRWDAPVRKQGNDPKRAPWHCFVVFVGVLAKLEAPQSGTEVGSPQQCGGGGGGFPPRLQRTHFEIVSIKVVVLCTIVPEQNLHIHSCYLTGKLISIRVGGMTGDDKQMGFSERNHKCLFDLHFIRKRDCQGIKLDSSLFLDATSFCASIKLRRRNFFLKGG